MPHRIVVVDDEPSMRTALGRLLQEAGFEVLEVEGGKELLAALPSARPDLIILDLMMPDMDGFDVLRELNAHPYIPVLMLTVRDDDEDKVVALEMGADDYVTKPFKPKELIARVKAILRRREMFQSEKTPTARAVTAGPLSVDVEGRVVRLNGKLLRLTATEFSLLRLFVTNPDRIFTRDEILDKVWGEEFIGDMRIVDNHIYNLRSKLCADGASAAPIQSVRGMGYKFAGERKS